MVEDVHQIQNVAVAIVVNQIQDLKKYANHHQLQRQPLLQDVQTGRVIKPVRSAWVQPLVVNGAREVYGVQDVEIHVISLPVHLESVTIHIVLEKRRLQPLLHHLFLL